MVSVIIPSYNRGSTIKLAIQSVLDQTYKNIEVIVIDDGSTDNTEEIILELNSDKVSYYKNAKNIGACGSRNRGINLAKGDYIAFQDSDDEWLPEKLERQLEFLSEEDCDIVSCSMQRIEGKKNEIYPPYVPENNSNSFNQLLFENFTSTQTILGKKKVFENYNFDERMPRFQDWELMLRISLFFNLKHLNKVLVKSYLQVNSISLNAKSAIAGLKLIYNIHKEAIEKNKSIEARFNLKIAEYMLANGENPKKYYKKTYDLSKSSKILLFYLMSKLSLNKLLFYFKKQYFSFKNN
ncbi:Glycosyl transferase family [Polaribacter dokdonensis DSW-5]|nr:Glycosyl transferase family [Polaribacter dokdonensis DSW-5]